MIKLSELIAENEDQIIVLRSISFDETGTEIISTVFFDRLKRIPEE